MNIKSAMQAGFASAMAMLGLDLSRPLVGQDPAYPFTPPPEPPVPGGWKFRQRILRPNWAVTSRPPWNTPRVPRVRKKLKMWFALAHSVIFRRPPVHFKNMKYDPAGRINPRWSRQRHSNRDWLAEQKRIRCIAA